MAAMACRDDSGTSLHDMRRIMQSDVHLIHAMNTAKVKYSPGQLVHHKRFDYRGVVADVDPVFQGTDEWYQQVARSRPPKDQPWYRVLVHDKAVETYVAERHLEEDMSGEPVNHPYVQQLFSGLQDGHYVKSKPH